MPSSLISSRSVRELICSFSDYTKGCLTRRLKPLGSPLQNLQSLALGKDRTYAYSRLGYSLIDSTPQTIATVGYYGLDLTVSWAEFREPPEPVGALSEASALSSNSLIAD